MNQLERWTSRKFWAMMVWQTVMVWLLWSGKLPLEGFVSVTWLLLGGYFASNVIQALTVSKVGEVLSITSNEKTSHE